VRACTVHMSVPSTTRLPKLKFTNTMVRAPWTRMAGTGVAHGFTFHVKNSGSMRRLAQA
jgi:hypothetical protein